MRPRSIVLFERLYILKIAIGLIVGLWTFASVVALMMPPGSPPWIQTRIMPMMAGSLALQVLIGVLLLYFIARRGSEIAMWVFIVLFAIGAAGMLRAYLGPAHRIELPAAVKLTGLVELAIEAAMVALLFRPDAKSWLAARPRTR